MLGTQRCLIRKRRVINAAHTIMDIVDAHGTGFCLITTAAPHGLNTTDTITVANNSIAGYNVNHGITQTPTVTTLETDVPYSADGFGGNWTLV